MLKEEKKRLQLSRFFSKNIVQKILSSDDNLKLGGERKNVTVLFADLRGFTTISETLDQKKVVELLNAYFTRMTPIIFKNNGTLDKLMGDGILALFGAPISYADDAVQAVKTAIELIMALREFNVQMKKYGMPHLDLSIGINTGEVVAGYIGSEEHLNYTVIGDPVNTAQRIQSVAGYNEILISEAVFDALDTEVHQISGLKSIEPISPLKLKGKQKILNAYRVVIS
jgi:adenylate cyclase